MTNTHVVLKDCRHVPFTCCVHWHQHLCWNQRAPQYSIILPYRLCSLQRHFGVKREPIIFSSEIKYYIQHVFNDKLFSNSCSTTVVGMLKTYGLKRDTSPVVLYTWACPFRCPHACLLLLVFAFSWVSGYLVSNRIFYNKSTSSNVPTSMQVSVRNFWSLPTSSLKPPWGSA